MTEFADDDYLLNISDRQKRSSCGKFKESLPEVMFSVPAIT